METLKEVIDEARRRAEEALAEAEAAIEAKNAESRERDIVYALITGNTAFDLSVASLIWWADETGVSLARLGEGRPEEPTISGTLLEASRTGWSREEVEEKRVVNNLAEFIRFVDEAEEKLLPGGGLPGRTERFGTERFDYGEVLAAVENSSTARSELETAGADDPYDRSGDESDRAQYAALGETWRTNWDILRKIDSDSMADTAAAVAEAYPDLRDQIMVLKMPSGFLKSSDRRNLDEAKEAALKVIESPPSTPAPSTPPAPSTAQTDYSKMTSYTGSTGGSRQPAAPSAPSTPATTVGPSSSRVAEIDAEIANLEAKMKSAPSMGAAVSIERQIAKLKAERAGVVATSPAQTDYSKMTSYTGSTGGSRQPGAASPDPRVAELEAENIALRNRLSGGGGGGAPRLSAEEIAQANRDEIYALLDEQFGGFSFFLNKHDADLHVGITADGSIVEVNDPAAVSTKTVLDVIVERGIVDLTRVRGILAKTNWYQTVDAFGRQFDVRWNDLTDVDRQLMLQPLIDELNNEAQFLGFDLDPDRAFRMAKTLSRSGSTEEDTDDIRDLLGREKVFSEITTEATGFGAAQDEIQKLAREYYVPIPDAQAKKYATEMYLGDRDLVSLEELFQKAAIAKFPTLEYAIDVLGVTPEQYFAPYQFEIEKMLDRPVDIFDEFSSIIEYVPDVEGGDSTPRPMTFEETRRFVRNLPEWQNSPQGISQAYALSEAIGRKFGAVT